jgi:hypothetical protein
MLNRRRKNGKLRIGGIVIIVVIQRIMALSLIFRLTL